MVKIYFPFAVAQLIIAFPTAPESKEDDIVCYAQPSVNSVSTKTYLSALEIPFDLSSSSLFPSGRDWFLTKDSCYVQKEDIPKSMLSTSEVQSKPNLHRRDWHDPKGFDWAKLEPYVATVVPGLPLGWEVASFVGGKIGQRIWSMVLDDKKSICEKEQTRIELTCDDLDGRIHHLQDPENPPRLPDEHLLEKLQHELDCAGYYEELYQIYGCNITWAVTRALTGQLTNEELRGIYETLKNVEFTEKRTLLGFQKFSFHYLGRLSKNCFQSSIFKQEVKCARDSGCAQ